MEHGAGTALSLARDGSWAYDIKMAFHERMHREDRETRTGSYVVLLLGAGDLEDRTRQHDTRTY